MSKAHPDRFDRYLRVVRWAQRRYQDHRGVLILSTGDRLSTYSRIEEAAFSRYIRMPRDTAGRLVFQA